MRLNAVLQAIAEQSRRVISPEVQFVVQLEQELATIRFMSPDTGDAIERLQWVIQALVQNAVEAMPNGGTLRLAASTTHLSGDDAARLTTLPGRHVVVSVGDTGCGMGEDIRANCFEPFISTKGRTGPGGLTVSYGIVVSAFGGRMEASSQRGHGTTMRVYLPAVDREK